MLFSDDDKEGQVYLIKAEMGIIISECRADEHDVINFATEGTTELVHEEIQLSRLSGPHDERVERNIASFHI